MTYNLNNPLDKERFKARCNYLFRKCAVVTLSEKAFRTLNQNNYLHLLIGVVAMDVGCSVKETKRIYFKQKVNPNIFVKTKVDPWGNTIETLRSSADLSKEEMSLAIDRFVIWGTENGFRMPRPGDRELLKNIEIELAKYEQYL